MKLNDILYMIYVSLFVNDLIF